MLLKDDRGFTLNGFISDGAEHHPDGRPLHFAQLIMRWWGWTKVPAEIACVALRERALLDGTEARLYVAGEGLRHQRAYLSRVCPALQTQVLDGLKAHADQMRELGVTPEMFRTWVADKVSERKAKAVHG